LNGRRPNAGQRASHDFATSSFIVCIALLDFRLGPHRIVCFIEATTKWLYLLEQESRIAGISGYTMRPRRARDEKPKVPDILQPGPAALTDGMTCMHRIVMAWMDTHGASPQ
jgi:hypothetical protein